MSKHARRHASLLHAALGAAALLAALSGPADARPNCNTSLCAYDVHNNAVGTLIQQNLLAHFYNGKPYSVQFDEDGLAVDAYFLFATLDCSGHAYAYYYGESQPTYTVFDGNDLWTAGPPTETITVHSYSWYYDYATETVKYQCVSYPGDPRYPWNATVSEPVLLDSGAARWVPPFSVR
jgi:hypothetical protein